jgi:hypothetical protein
MSQSHFVLPIYPAYARRIVGTSAVVWLLIRVVLVLVAKTVMLTAGASLLLVGAAVLLVWFDGRRFHEHLFHSNLGTPTTLVIALITATVGALEGLTIGLLIVLGY